MEISAYRNTQRIVNDNTQLLVSPAKAGYIERLDEKIFIKKGLNIIGREHYCHIVIPNEALSSKHALIYVEDEDKHFVCDLKSTNGTKVNDELISDKAFHPLNDGDTVSFGGYDVIYFKLAEGIGGILNRSTDGIQTTSTQAIENDATDPLDDSFEFPSASDVDGLFERSANNFTIPETPPNQSTPKNRVTNETAESCTNTSMTNVEESGDVNEGEGSICHNSDASFKLVLEDTFNFNNSDNAATNSQNKLCDKVESQALRIEEENDEIVTEAIDEDNQIPIEDLCTQACDNGAPTIYAGEPQQSIGANDETMVVTHEEENSKILIQLAKEVENPVPRKNSQEAYSSSSDDEDESLFKTDVCSLPATQILPQKSSVKRCARKRNQQEEALEDSLNADLNRNGTDSSALNSKSNESPDEIEAETLVIDEESSKMNKSPQVGTEIEDLCTQECEPSVSNIYAGVPQQCVGSADNTMLVDLETSNPGNQLESNFRKPPTLKEELGLPAKENELFQNGLSSSDLCSLPATQILPKKLPVKLCTRTRKQQEDALKDSLNKNGPDASVLNSNSNESPDEIEAETLVIDEENSKINKSPQVSLEEMYSKASKPGVSNIYAGVPQQSVGLTHESMPIEIENSNDVCSLPATQILPKKSSVKRCTRTRKQQEEALEDSLNADLNKNRTDSSALNSKSNESPDEIETETLVIDEEISKMNKSPQVASQISIEDLCTQECEPGVSNVYAGEPQQYAGFADETMLFDLKTSNGQKLLESNFRKPPTLKEELGLPAKEDEQNGLSSSDLCSLPATQILPKKLPVKISTRTKKQREEALKDSLNKNGTDSSVRNSKSNESPDEIEAETLVIDEENNEMNKSPQVSLDEMSRKAWSPVVSNFHAGVPQQSVGLTHESMPIEIENSNDVSSLPATQILPKKSSVKHCTRTRKQQEEFLEDSLNADLNKNRTDASVSNSKSNRYTDETEAETLVIEEVSRKISKSPQVASQISIEDLCTQECEPGVSNVYAGEPQQYAGFADETMLFDLKTSNGQNPLESNFRNPPTLKEDLCSPAKENEIFQNDSSSSDVCSLPATQILPKKLPVKICTRTRKQQEEALNVDLNKNGTDSSALNSKSNESPDEIETETLVIDEESSKMNKSPQVASQISIEDLCTQECEPGVSNVYAGEPQQYAGFADETMLFDLKTSNGQKLLESNFRKPPTLKEELGLPAKEDEQNGLSSSDLCSLPATQILPKKLPVKICTRTRKQREEALKDSLNKNGTDSSVRNSKSNKSPDEIEAETLLIDEENSKMNKSPQVGTEIEDLCTQACEPSVSNIYAGVPQQCVGSADNTMFVDLETSNPGNQLESNFRKPPTLKEELGLPAKENELFQNGLSSSDLCSLPATQILPKKLPVKLCTRTRKQREEALKDSLNKNGTDSSVRNSKSNETPDKIEAETLVIDEENNKKNKSSKVSLEEMSTKACTPVVSNFHAGVPQQYVGLTHESMPIEIENSNDVSSLPATQILPKKSSVKRCTRTRKQQEEVLEDSLNADLNKNGTDASVSNSKSNRYTDETEAETLVIDEVSRKITSKSPQVASQISIEDLCTQECEPCVSNVYAGVPQQYAGFADETMLFDLKTSNGQNQLESKNVDSSTPQKEEDSQSKISQLQPKDVHNPQIHSNSDDDDDDDDVSLLTNEATQLLPMKIKVSRCPRKPFKHVDSSKKSSNADSNCNKVDNVPEIDCVKVVPVSKIIHDDSSTDDDLFPEDMVLDKSLNQRQPKISVEKVKTMNQLQNCVSKTPSVTKKTNSLEDLKNDLMTQPIISFESIRQIHNYLSKSQSSSEENKSVDSKNDVLTESSFKKPSSNQVKKSSIFENISKCDPDEMISPVKSETISQIQDFISKSSSKKECNSLEDLKNDLLTQPIFPKPGPSNQIKKSSIKNATNFSPDEISLVKSESLTQIKDYVSKNESRTRKENQTTVSAILENVESGADEIPASPGRSESTSQIQQFVSKSRTRSLSSRESVCEAEATQTKAKRTRVPSRKMKEANEDATAKEKKRRGRPRKVVIEDDDSSPEIVITSKKTSINSVQKPENKRKRAEDGLLSLEADTSTSKYPKLEVTKSTTTNQPNDEMDLDIADMIKMRKRSTSIRPGSLHLVKPSQNHNVIFTSIKKSSDLPNKMKKLGGTIGTSPADCTVLVAEEVKRTVKFLCVVGLGKPIVDPKWVHDSYQANSFLDPMKYVLKDLKKEAEFHFNLENSLQKAKEEPLLKKYSVFVTPSVKPPPSEMKEIIECCGGRFLDNLPIRWPANSLIISCKEDEVIYRKWKLKAKPFKILEAEGLIKAILQQHLNFDIHVL